MILYCFVIVLLFNTDAKYIEKEQFCQELRCEKDDLAVCGIREEGAGFRVRLFKSECDLLKYGCQVDEKKAYGLISMEYCERSMSKDFESQVLEENQRRKFNTKDCSQYQCDNNPNEVCGLRQDGRGFQARLFKNRCDFQKTNCENNFTYEPVEISVCYEDTSNIDVNTHNKNIDEPPNFLSKKQENVIIIGAPSSGNINETIHNFFAATHVFDLPLRDITEKVNETSRRMLIKNAGPVKVFVPWVKVPANKSTDHDHAPTLGSCFHKCPKKCPDTYSPVCGVPGVSAREPSLMFKNHCFMDVAQCKMKWEAKSITHESSFYLESTFYFCLGDELNSLYRLLPLIKTLQRMGRLKKKGHFRYKFKNMRFFNELLADQPKLMG